ncbi:MAG: hypothetical protein GY940_06130 [bacterium]|nr:hypothetical protein [bacterium]
MKNKLVIINITLVLVILLFVSLNFFERKLQVHYEYGQSPTKIIDLLKKEFDEKTGHIKQKMYLVFAYNQNPTRSELEVIEKLNHKYKDKVNIAALFTSKFRTESPLSFKHRFLSGTRIEMKKGNSVMDESFFLLLNKGKSQYISEHFDLLELVMLIQGKLFPHLDYKDYVVSPTDLKLKVKEKLKLSSVNLLNVNTGTLENKNLSGLTNAYLYHTDCSPCALKSILSRIKIKEVFEKTDHIIIFSALANSIALSDLIAQNNITAPIYVDKMDELDLLTVITEESQEPVEIILGEENQK